jgi:hypothetical protein
MIGCREETMTMPMPTTISEKRTTSSDRGREDKPVDRASIRKSILGSLGKPDRRPCDVVEHSLRFSIQV